MADKAKPRTQLVNLEIVESSGVNVPANLSPGWVVIKSAEAAIAAALRKRAEDLGLVVDAEAINAIASTAVTDEGRGRRFVASEYDRQLKAAATPAPTRKADDALVMAHLAGLREQIEALEAETASLRSARTEASTEPEPDAREILLTRQAEAVVGELKSQGASREEVIRRGSGGSRPVAPLEELRAKLVERAAEPAGPDPEVTAVAALIRSARLAKDLSQGDFADKLGVSRRTVVGWESGETMPHGLRVTAVAGVLGLGIEDARKIAKAARKS